VLQHFDVGKTPIKDANQFRIREYYGPSRETRTSDWRGGNIVAIYSPSLDNQVTLRLLPNDFSRKENPASHLSAKLSLSSGIFVRKHLDHTDFTRSHLGQWEDCLYFNVRGPSKNDYFHLESFPTPSRNWYGNVTRLRSVSVVEYYHKWTKRILPSCQVQTLSELSSPLSHILSCAISQVRI
jgi:hypothetical protein